MSRVLEYDGPREDAAQGRSLFLGRILLKISVSPQKGGPVVFERVCLGKGECPDCRICDTLKVRCNFEAASVSDCLGHDTVGSMLG